MTCPFLLSALFLKFKKKRKKKEQGSSPRVTTFVPTLVPTALKNGYIGGLK